MTAELCVICIVAAHRLDHAGLSLGTQYALRQMIRQHPHRRSTDTKKVP
ncbi:hypothetical protein [Streptomyces sp. NPDC048057]